MRIGALAAGTALGMLVMLGAPAARAQVAPNAHWRTIRTEHFRVHFTPELDRTGRRAAVDAERAYAALARRLHVPRGPIDLVVADNVDYANGFTTPFPTNRIVVYSHPPLDVISLRYYDDWLELVITHELTHVFHLDRTRGWWRTAQRIFGRAPFLFPNLYEPSWITEGLATFYESDVTHAGRVAGTYERMLVDADALHHDFMFYDRWSLASTRYPGGDVPYGFGALFLRYIADTRGDTAVPAFVERESGKVLPFFLNSASRDAFGITFRDAWREWRDTLAAYAVAPATPLAGWRDLTHVGRTAVYPRWEGDSALVYSRADWKSSGAAYRVTLDGVEHRLGRRNGDDANVPLPDGGLLFSQLEFTDPYHVRADLYEQRDGGVSRLTHDARLAQPDVRGDGAIVAVRFLPASTELVRLSADARTVTVLTPASPDTMWAEPRWSPRGDRIAATRWTRGGWADVVILDTLGHVIRALTDDRAFDGTPSWTPDGSHVLFTSDRTGVTDVYIAPVDGDEAPRRVSHAPLGLFYPAVSPDGRLIAAARYDDDGWHVGVAPFDTSHTDAPGLLPTFAPVAMDPPSRDSSAEHAYSPWRTLLPRFWLPLAGQTTKGNYSIGVFTTGSDVVGRHTYFAQALADPLGREHTFDVRYEYAGLGQPLVDVGGSQDWERQTVLDTNGTVAGQLVRRMRTVSLGLTVTRPSFRTYSFASLSGELEMRRYDTEPDALIGRLSEFYASNPRYWSLVASGGWSNAQRPVTAISFEDGISFAFTGRLRWLEGASAIQSRSLSAVLDGYKSLDLGGFAHHVIAARVAGGIATGADPGEYDVGGSNGTPVAVFPGFTVGSHHTFAVRGFPSGARSGPRVLTASLEYRAPLSALHRGFGFWPVFLDRTSLAFFTDAGTSWSGVPGAPLDGKPIASAGAEIDVDAGLQYDVPYRLRLGVAAPYVNNSVFNVSPASVYFQIGFAF